VECGENNTFFVWVFDDWNLWSLVLVLASHWCIVHLKLRWIVRVACKVKNNSFGRVVRVYASDVWWMRRPFYQIRTMVRLIRKRKG
jgi:hypothetical protein